MTTAIIPARGGSKGLKRKNLRRVGLKTLVELAVSKCMEAGFDTWVSTDDVETVFAAMRVGARVIKRPDELATDEALTWPVIQHAANFIGCGGDIALIQCTAPLVSTQDYLRCVDERGEADMAVLCHPFHGVVMDEFGTILNRERGIVRRQDMPPQYVLSGSAWAFDVSYLEQEFYSGVVKPIPIDGDWFDIDTEADLQFARHAIQREQTYPVRIID
jgi:CMP-N-acetylneuraminic acid synthetase